MIPKEHANKRPRHMAKPRQLYRCESCNGTGKMKFSGVKDVYACGLCNGSGVVEPDKSPDWWPTIEELDNV